MTQKTEQPSIFVRYRDVQYPKGQIGPAWEWSIWCRPDAEPIVARSRDEAFLVILASLVTQGVERQLARRMANEMHFVVQQEWMGGALSYDGMEQIERAREVGGKQHMLRVVERLQQQYVMETAR